jgi:hypothetical protein
MMQLSQQAKTSTATAATTNSTSFMVQIQAHDDENMTFPPSKRSPADDFAAEQNESIPAAGHQQQQHQQQPRLEELKQREAELAAQLAAVRREKLVAIRSKPLTIGIVGFGRFGQFIGTFLFYIYMNMSSLRVTNCILTCNFGLSSNTPLFFCHDDIGKAFSKYGKVVGTSRSDYTDIANKMGATYIPLSDPDAFLAQNLDVIVFAVSIMSFESTIQSFVPHLEKDLERRKASANGQDVHGPLIVDVLSVKEHSRQIMLKYLPKECDILCTRK